MSEVAISCPSCGGRLEVSARTAPPPAREQRWRALSVSWCCRHVDIDRPEPPQREIDPRQVQLGSVPRKSDRRDLRVCLRSGYGWREAT
jgi:hypothetical protein